MKKFLPTVAAVVLLTACSHSAQVAGSSSAPVAGKWATEAVGANGAPNHAYEFKVAGEKLTGVHTTGGDGSTLEVKEGIVSGSKFSFHIVSATGQGAGIKRKMSGEVKGDLFTLNREALGLDGTVTPMAPLEFKRVK